MSRHEIYRATFAITGVISVLSSVAFSQEVTLPLEEYEALRKRADPESTPATVPKTPFTIEEATLEIRAGLESAEVDQRITLSIYREGWQAIPLPSVGSLTSVEMGGLEGRVSAEGGCCLLKARGPGRHPQLLRSAVGVQEDRTSSRPMRSFRLELPRAGVVNGSIEVDPSIEEVRIEGGALARGELAGSRLAFVGEPGAELEAVLSARASAEPTSLPLRFEASSNNVTFVERNRLVLRSFLTAELLQGELRELKLTLAPGFEVAAVEPDTIGWTLEDKETLLLHPLAPVPDQLSATVSLTGPLSTSFAAPLLVPLGATKRRLVSGLRMEAEGIPILLDAGSARRITAGELDGLPPPVLRTLARAFVVPDPERAPRWRIEWSDVAQRPVLVTQVDRLIVDALVGDAGRIAYQCWMEVRTSGSMQVTFEPPASFELASATRDGRPVSPGRDGSGISIPLAAGRDLQIIHFEGILPAVAPSERAGFALELPEVSVPVGTIEVRAVLPGAREYRRESRVHRAAQRLPPGIYPVPLGYSVVTAGWSALTSTPEPLIFRVDDRRAKRRWF